MTGLLEQYESSLRRFKGNFSFNQSNHLDWGGVNQSKMYVFFPYKDTIAGCGGKADTDRHRMRRGTYFGPGQLDCHFGRRSGQKRINSGGEMT